MTTRSGCSLAALLLLGVIGPSLVRADELAAGFREPPEAARPRTWWHWTMSNVSLEGITKDLEWMQRSGLAGFQLADVAYGGGQDVATKTPFGTPGWYEAVRHAAAEADRLGLEMAIFSSPGWSETGGPWVRPEQAMKKLVWSELEVVGGQGPQRLELPAPPRNTGQIRNTSTRYYGTSGEEVTHYGDSAVLAYPILGDDGPAPPPVAVRTHAGPIDAAALLDDQLDTVLTVPAAADGVTWLEYHYAEPVVARALTLGGRGGSARGIPVGRALASLDGENFSPVLTLPGAQLYRQGMVRTYAFEPVRARVIRVELTAAPLGPAPTMSQEPTAPATEYFLSEMVVHTQPRVHRWEEKAGFSFLFEYDTVPTPRSANAQAVPAEAVVDLTDRLQSDGALGWEVPDGRWRIVRLGYSLTGARNRPATPEGSGFEADKLSREHMEAYVRGYFDPIQQALGPLFGRSLRYVMMDSWEAGTNNWTEEILAEFQRRRGYNPRPFLPVLTGQVVESGEVSDRFTWDFRRTLADLWAEHHYGTMAEKLRERGLGIYAEAAGVSLEMPEDTLLNKSKVEIPMGEFWVRDLHPRLMYLQDVRGAASAAHVYGKRFVAAEAFTGGGFESPATLKVVADYWMAQGVNRFVFHTSAHQPLDTKPGNMMVGTHLHRNITWAEQARPFVDYLARSSHLLQQGKFVADIAYLLDEGAPSTPPIWGPGTKPAPPEGYDYDFINADVLLNRLAVDAEGRLVLPDGTSYRLLVLPETRAMRPELLRKIRELVRGGAAISGPRPRSSPSLMEYPHCDDEVQTLAEEIWGDLDGESRTVRHVGRGVVSWGWPLDEVLRRHGVPRDFTWSRGLDTELVWLHRRTEEVDLYFVANQTGRAEAIEGRFRVQGRLAEVWRSDTGEIAPASFTQADGFTTVPLTLDAHEAVFVVFRGSTRATQRVVPTVTSEPVMTLTGNWTVRFAPGLGAPELEQVWTELRSWAEHEQPGVSAFSGQAEYRTEFTVDAALRSGEARLQLDLGKVGDLAVIQLNGREIGTVWKPPYRIDVTDALRAGVNQLSVRVINQWTNRLLADAALPEDQRVLKANVPSRALVPRGASGPPPSGLLGPVVLQRVVTPP